jgi:hypothetical protein
MTLKNAATFAFIGTLLAAALLVWNFVFDVINLADGLIPLTMALSALVYAFAAVSMVVFFFAFRKTQS